MRRTFTLSLLLLCTNALFARVLSYSPYSDSPGGRGFHERTTRHFLALEGAPTWPGTHFERARVVLYDSTGAEEPRVIYTSDSAVAAAALFQSDPARRPMILVSDGRGTFFSPDGGVSWREGTRLTIGTGRELDRGGPSTYGLAATVQTGNEQYPFVTVSNQFAVAVDAAGNTRPVAPATALLGRNRAGTRFLARDGTMLRVIGLDFTVTLATNVDALAGWITAEGDAYVIMRNGAKRELRLYREFTSSVVAEGPHLVAIPTTDFDGAWIATRDASGTTLSRHGLRRRLETMWIDPATPEIEALHAGEEALLIQLAHGRPPGLSRNGVSLAIWRPGQPAPREYHDLLGRMNAMRGFVHLDVDAVANGAPFVFDTYFNPWVAITVPAGAPRPATTAGGADIVQEWGILRASLRQRLVVQGLARVTGVGGTEWRSNLLLYNPLDEAQTVELRLEDSHVTTITLARRELRLIRDAVGTLFGLERGGGTLTIVAADRVVASVRTYAQSRGGSAGFVAPAVDAGNVASARFPAIFSGAFPSPGYRTNLFVTDPFGTTQTNGLPRGEQQRAAIVRPTHGSVIASVVAIDNHTNDATHYLPDPTSPAQLVKSIPLVASIDHPDGSRTRTDLYLYNPTTARHYIGIAVRPYAGGELLRKGITIEPLEARVVHDPLVTIFGVTGRAQIDFGTGPFDNNLNGLTPAVRVTTRTYTTTADGGTYGMAVPPVSVLQIATEGESLELFTEADAGLRVELTLLDLSWFPSRKSQPHVDVYGADGERIDSFLLEAKAGQPAYVVDDLFASRGLTPQPVRIVATIGTGASNFTAYVTLTDRRNGDTSYIAPHYGGADR